jgi:hypothetical protein
MKIGDRVIVNPVFSEDCADCRDIDFSCAGLKGVIYIIQENLWKEKPFGVDLDCGEQCQYSEDEMEII